PLEGAARHRRGRFGARAIAARRGSATTHVTGRALRVAPGTHVRRHGARRPARNDHPRSRERRVALRRSVRRRQQHSARAGRRAEPFACVARGGRDNGQPLSLDTCRSSIPARRQTRGRAMKRILIISAIIVTAAVVATVGFQIRESPRDAAAVDEQAEAETEAASGPHGGRLLRDGETSVEIMIVENGFPPELSLYAYRDHDPVDPARVSATVQLDRLGGKRDALAFLPE